MIRISDRSKVELLLSDFIGIEYLLSSTGSPEIKITYKI